MAILEALACSLPCLITTACHFAELAQARGAIVVDAEQHAVCEGLRCLLSMTDGDRKQMGRNGYDLVERNYTWAQQAKCLASVYRWLTGKGPQPEHVIL